MVYAKGLKRRLYKTSMYVSHENIHMEVDRKTPLIQWEDTLIFFESNTDFSVIDTTSSDEVKQLLKSDAEVLFSLKVKETI